MLPQKRKLELKGASEDEHPKKQKKSMLTVARALKKIDGVTDSKEEVDVEDIVNRLEDDEVEDLVEQCLERIVSGDRSHFQCFFEIFKELIILSNILLMDNDSPEPSRISQLERCLELAVEVKCEEAVRFFLWHHPAGCDVGIRAAIENNSPSMLRVLNAKITNDYAVFIASLQDAALQASGYFLEQNFPLSSELLLEAAVIYRNAELITEVCSHTNIEDVYDLLRFLIKKDGTLLIPVIYQYFGTVNVLKELQNQDDDPAFIDIVLTYAQLCLSVQEKTHPEVVKLIHSFKVLIEHSTLLAYPDEKFSGARVLDALRKEIAQDQKLSTEQRIAANLLGTPLSTANRYLTDSPYHRSLPDQAERYFRSGLHPTTLQLGEENTFFCQSKSLPQPLGKKGVVLAHNGLYKVPLDGLNKYHGLNFKERKTEHPNNKDTYKVGQGELYDRLLEFKNDICKRIVTKCASSKSTIRAGHYHEYPCVMVYIKFPESVISHNENPEGYTQIAISTFVALVNFNAQRNGLDIELVRRSSFGFLTPTIAPCGQSFRINVGLIPHEYVTVLINSLIILNQTLELLFDEKKVSEHKLEMQLPDSCFLTTTAYQKYMANETIPKPQNILQLTRAKISRGRIRNGGATNLMRTCYARDGLTAYIFEELRRITPNTSMADFANMVLRSLRWGFSKMVIESGSLHFQKKEVPKIVPFLVEHRSIKDNAFFQMIAELLKVNVLDNSIPKTYSDQLSLKNSLEECVRTKSVKNLFYHLELLNELLFARAIYTSPVSRDQFDFYGSDSETETEKQMTKQPRLYAKKIIVRNGMRALSLSLCAGADLLFPNHKNETEKQSVFLHGTYYETIDLLKSLAPFKKIPKNRSLLKSGAQILMCDANPCVAIGDPLPDLKSQLANVKLLIVDTTSATTQQYREWVKTFLNQDKMQILIFASSGFKNEGLGNDKNPYGTIRIVTKDKGYRDTLVQIIRDQKEPILSRVSHTYRRYMKSVGMIPRNHKILELPENRPSPMQLEPFSLFARSHTSFSNASNENATNLNATNGFLF